MLDIGCYTAFAALMEVDCQQAMHGRAPAQATGVKRVLPDRLVFTLRGDGDMITEGYPIRLPEMLTGFEGVAYLARGTVHTPAGVKKTKKLLRAALGTQRRGLGFSLVEVVTMCPTGWFVTPAQGLEVPAGQAAAGVPGGGDQAAARPRRVTLLAAPRARLGARGRSAGFPERPPARRAVLRAPRRRTRA
ncbi:MAG: hypothetical protein AB1689_22115 [Thermodesulfobacteriota bacterium]